MMRIARRFAVMAAISLMATNGFAADFVESAGLVDNAVNLVYDPSDGSASLIANGLEGMTTASLKSAGGHFDPAKASTSDPPNGFDQNSASSFFRLTAQPNHVGSLDFDAGWLPSGLSAADIVSDVSYLGSLFPSGAWQDAAGGGAFVVVPEPASLALAFCGLLGLLSLRRK